MRKLLGFFIAAALLFGVVGTPTPYQAAAQASTMIQPYAPAVAHNGTIFGRVQAARAGLIVQAFDQAGNLATKAETDELGAYVLTRLAPGTYHLEVLTSERARLPLKHEQSVQIEDTDSMVEIPALELLPEASLLDRQATAAASATIQGTVTGSGYGALPTAYVSLYEAGNHYESFSAAADSNGVYTFTVPAGSYAIKFDRYNQFAAEWYNNQPNRENATILTVADGTNLTGIDAELALGGSISGTVTNEGGTPLRYVYVRALSGNEEMSYALTAANGTYQLKGLPAGSFQISFQPGYPNEENYIKEYYNNQLDPQNATLVPVTLGNNTPDIHAALGVGGAISGTLTAADSGEPLAGSFFLYNSQTADEDNFIDSGYTNDGQYVLHGLAPGVYYLRAKVYNLPYLSEYYENQSTLAQATPLSIAAGQTQQIHFSLERSATITGQVSAAGNGNLFNAVTSPQATPLPGARITLYDANKSWAASTTANAQGYYTFTALTSGAYYLYFSGADNQNYIPEYYNRKATLAEADPVQLTAPQTTRIDAELAEGGLLSGRVTAVDSGLPLENVQVGIYRRDDCNRYRIVDGQQTNASGYYTVTGLISDTYYVYFDTPYASEAAKAYLSQPYRATMHINLPYGGGGSMPADLGDPVAVSAGTQVTNIDAALTRGGQIAGRITAEDSSLPLSDVYVQVYTLGQDYLFTTSVGANGTYTTPALLGGSYLLAFQPSMDGSSAAYVPEYYDNQIFAVEAISIPVTSGALTPGIDISLMRGAQISGTVTADDTGDPLYNVVVQLLPASFEGIGRYAYTDENGQFTTPGHPDGRYKLRFVTNQWDEVTREYVDEYYNDQPAWESATPITFTTATLYTGYNASLARGGQISGTVTADGTGMPLENVEVYAYTALQEAFSSGRTESNGNYTLYGVPAGPVKVKFLGPVTSQQCLWTTYADEYYNNKPSFATADAVTVTPPATTPNIDASLAIEKLLGQINLFLPLILRP